MSDPTTTNSGSPPAAAAAEPATSAPAAPTPTPATVKPGWKTTEFYLSVAAFVLGSLAASGVILPGTPAAEFVGIALSALAALGYTRARTVAKRAAPLLVLFWISGCVDAFATVKATAATANEAVVAFKAWDTAHVRAVLKKAHEMCDPAPSPYACFSEALLPYQNARAPVLTASDFLGPVLLDSEKAARAGKGNPATLGAALMSLLGDFLQAVVTLKAQFAMAAP